jgi:hypothetical protein
MKSISALVLVFAILETGCYHPVTRINGPSESKEGVKVELVSVDCRLRDDDPDIGYVVDLAMKVAVTNGSDRNVQFHPDRMRLLDSRTRPSYGNKVSISIGKGERRVAQLEFIENGSLSCAEKMKLDPADSLTLGEPVQVAPIGFIAED